jgi:hypothetical protein
MLIRQTPADALLDRLLSMTIGNELDLKVVFPRRREDTAPRPVSRLRQLSGSVSPQQIEVLKRCVLRDSGTTALVASEQNLGHYFVQR